MRARAHLFSPPHLRRPQTAAKNAKQAPKAEDNSPEKTVSEEDEDEVALVDEHILEEERKLKEEHEARLKAEEEKHKGEKVDLDESKYTNLNALLDQTTIYSKFLAEQMEDGAMPRMPGDQFYLKVLLRPCLRAGHAAHSPATC